MSTTNNSVEFFPEPHGNKIFDHGICNLLKEVKMKITLTGIYYIDCATLNSEYLLIWNSINIWNEVNEYSKTDKLEINKRLLEDCLCYQQLCRDFSNLYKETSSEISLDFIFRSSEIKAIYISFKKS